MPWKEIDPMTEKERFVHLALSGKFAISELCDQHGISRKTEVSAIRGSRQFLTKLPLPFPIPYGFNDANSNVRQLITATPATSPGDRANR